MNHGECGGVGIPTLAPSTYLAWPTERLRITCSQDVEPREFSVWYAWVETSLPLCEMKESITHVSHQHFTNRASSRLPPTGTRVSPQPPLNYAQGTALQSKLGHLSQEFAHRVVELEKTEKQQAARITALEREVPRIGEKSIHVFWCACFRNTHTLHIPAAQLVILEEVRRKEHQRLLQQHVSMMQQWLSSARTAAAAAPEGTAAAKEYKRLERKVQAVTAELAVCSQAAQDATNRRQELGIASLQLPAPGAVVLGNLILFFRACCFLLTMAFFVVELPPPCASLSPTIHR